MVLRVHEKLGGFNCLPKEASYKVILHGNAKQSATHHLASSRTSRSIKQAKNGLNGLHSQHS
jgi:hypothetical protein